MKKKFSVSSFLAGALASALMLGTVLPVLASELKTAELYFNDISIRLNGTPLSLSDANGDAVEPFIIDGTTYLPVRSISEALGLNVSWDGETNTVVLGNDVEMEQPAMWLGEMTTFTGTHIYEELTIPGVYDDDFTANDGSTYVNLYRPTNCSYLLKGAYSTFTGTFYLSMAQKNNASYQYRFHVLLDDELVYTSEIVASGILPQPFTVDVSDAYKMEIVLESDYLKSAESWSTTNSTVSFGEAALWS